MQSATIDVQTTPMTRFAAWLAGSAVTRSVFETVERVSADLLLAAVFRAIQAKALLSKEFRANLYQDLADGRKPWSAVVVFRTRDRSVARQLVIREGKVSSGASLSRP